MNAELQSLEQVKASLLDMAIRFGPKLLAAALIMVAGYYAARWVGRALDRLLLRFHFEPPERVLLDRIGELLVLALFAIIALQNLGVELLPLIAGLSVAGAGIALAMQGVLGNVAAGLTIIFTRPFHIGDYISIAREEGDVLEITLFSTTLGHPDRSKVVIPNRKIAGEILHNYGRIRQLSLVVGVAYGADVTQALRAVDDVLRALPTVLQDPAPVIGIVRLTDSGVNLNVNPWVAIPDYVASIAAVNQAILEAFRARGIAPAYPQLEVTMRQEGDGRALSAP